MLGASDWTQLIVFVSLSAFVGGKTVSFAKSGEYRFAWGGWLWMPVFLAQGLSGFLVCRTDGKANAATYEMAMVLHLGCLVLALVAAFSLHHLRRPKATMVLALACFFGMLTTTCMFFVQTRAGGFLYLTSMPWMASLTYKAVEVALTKDSYTKLSVAATPASTTLQAPAGEATV